MNILFLTQWYLPEPLNYQSDLAETLRDQGHEVTVLTGFPNWPTGKLAYGYRIRPWQRETINGIPVIRVPLYPDHSTSAFHRALNFLSLASFATASRTVAGSRLRSDSRRNFPPVTLGFPALVLGSAAASADYLRDSGYVAGNAAGDWHGEERNGFGHCGLAGKMGVSPRTTIRVISPGFRDNLMSKNVSAEKIHVISNWVDTRRVFAPREPSTELAEEYGLKDRFNVMFAGTLGLAQGLDTVLEAASQLGDLPDVQFVFVGDGADLPHLRQIADEHRLANVRFIGRVPADVVAKLYPLADVLLVHLRRDPLFRITIPHKVFTYMASGRPVLAAVEGDTAGVVLAAKAGLTCTPGDARSIADAVRQLAALSPTERQAMA